MEFSFLRALFDALDPMWAVLIGGTAIGLHFYLKFRSAKHSEAHTVVDDTHHDLVRLSDEVRFLTEENRKLRYEIIELRKTYVDLLEKYMVLQQHVMTQVEKSGK